MTPLERDPGQDPYDPNGLQTLCRGCHVAKTARENRRPLTPAEAVWRDLVEGTACGECGIIIPFYPFGHNGVPDDPNSKDRAPQAGNP